jgi:5'-3' exonuclease
MGIPSFYRQLVKTNPSLIRQKTTALASVLALDLNCAIYHCLAKLQKKTPFESVKRVEFEDTLIKMVIQYIVKLRDHVHPTNILYVAVDGVVPMAKIRQQRMRRFKSVWQTAEENKIKGTEGKEGWDRNAITPGTDFMDKLTKRLEDWGKVQIGGPKTIISGVYASGEGEQKIMSYLREIPPLGEVVVYGLDADLIVLCLWHLREYGWSFKLLREEVEMTGGVKVNEKGEENLLYFDINQLAVILNDRWAGVDLRDYVGAMSFLGNDFVPHGLTLCIREDGIDRLMEILQEIGKPLVIKDIEGFWTYDKEVLMALVKTVASNEKKWVLSSLVKKLKMSSRGYPPKPGTAEPSEIEKEMNALNLLPLSWKVERSLADRNEETGWYLLDNWAETYYDKFLWGATAERSVEEWLKAVQWILNYYTGSKPVDMLWYYPWYLPPLFADVLKYGGCVNSDNGASNIINPITPIAQLIMVLPIESYALLPTNKRGLPFKNPEYYPKAWTFFSAGRRMLWECEPMIPMLPYSVISNFLPCM